MLDNSRGFCLRGRMSTLRTFMRVTVIVGTIFLQISVIYGQYYGENGGIETVWARSGSNASLPCLGANAAATGAGQQRGVSRVQWWREDRMIAKWENGRLLQWEGNAHVSLASGAQGRHALLFRPVTFADNGDYQCLVDSQLQSNTGTREGIVRLRVQDVPEPPGMPLIMGFTSRSVNLSWAPSVFNRNSPILHYIIHIRVGEKGVWDSSNTIRTKDNQTIHEVSALQPYTVYSFRVLAVNAIGTSAASKDSYYMVTLREVPSGKPTITGAHNVSSSSIRIQWAPPPKHTIHGEFLGYRLTYRPRERIEAQREVVLNDASAGHYTIRNLQAFTDYTISVQVFNPAGRGPAAMINVMTDEGVPSAPLNLTYIKVTKSSVRLRWLEPEFPNGVIKAYYIYFLELAADKTDVRRTYEIRNIMNYTLDGLKPYTKYKIWVKAKTGKEEGAASATVTIETDVDGPSAPKIFNLTCQSLDSIFVQWQQPETFYHKIDYYYVLYRSESSYGFEEIPMLAAEDRSDHAMFIPNLTSNLLYEVMVQGASHSIIEHSKIYKGAASEPRKVILREKCTVNGNSGSYEKITAGLIAGVVCASFALILAIISFILWSSFFGHSYCMKNRKPKYFQAAYYYLDDPPGNRASPQLSETYDESEYTPVPAHLWSKHVSDLHADGDIGFSREYEAIQHVSDLDLSSEHSQLVENKSKNRYVNIVAYDHTRVVLKPVSGQKKSPDYINANYIDGYCKSRAYIGTQGPLPSTFDDYWRMIWEQRVFIVVMITNLVERGRRKCDMYWPKEGAETYGVIQVKMIQELTMATYTLRVFVIRNVKLKKKQASERTIYQYHYTNWPDHGVPEHSLPVLSFVRKSAAANPLNGGPIIVHCSAGVGRTGTYIVLDAMLKQIKHRQSINVFGFLRHIRQQRNYLVQTEEQYIFIHDALLEAMESGDTEVERSQLGRYLQTLQHSESNDIAPVENEKPIAKSWSVLEKQFRLVTCFKAKDFNVVSALKPCNKSKNRTLNLIPIESHRVHITPKPATDGSDYINATFLHGFNKLREFILTQHPVFETIADFWQMVWDHNSQTVVLLSPIIEKEFPQFWPDSGEESDYGSFKLKLSEEKVQGSFVTRDFILQSTQDDYELTCRLMQCAGWPESCSSPLPSVFELVQLVQEWHLEYQNGPMIVIDRNGGTEAATFCCLTTLYKQLEYENSVDVYVCAKLYHIRRPGIWRSQDDFLFLYRALESIANNPSCSDKSAGGGVGPGANNADTSFCSSQGGMVTNGHVNSNGHAVLPSKGASESLA